MRLLIITFFLFIQYSSSQVFIEVSCDFENPISDSICNYKPTANTELRNWSVQPSIDRVSNRTDGPLTGVRGSDHYLLHHGKYGGLETPFFDLEGTFCLSLDYYVLQFHTELNITMNNITLFRRNGATSYVDQWQHFETTQRFTGPTQIRIQAAGGYWGIGRVALDNLLFSRGECPQISDDLECDFTNDYHVTEENPLGCPFLKPILNPHNTLLIEISNELAVTGRHWQNGPDKTVFGRYLKVSNPNNEEVGEFRVGEIFIGEFLPSDGQKCLSFEHRNQKRMHWQFIESSLDLNIENVIQSSQEDGETGWRDGHHGGGGPMWWWFSKKVTIDPIVGINVTMRFKGLGEIGFTNFRLKNGKCPPLVSCNFRTDLCSFKQTLHWMGGFGGVQGFARIGTGRVSRPEGMVNNPSMSDVIRVPAIPHPEGHKFMYVDFTDGGSHNMNIIQLVSEMIPAGTYCLRYDYFNNQMGLVNIMIYPGGDEGGAETVKYGFNCHPPIFEWTEEMIDVKLTQPMRIVFYGNSFGWKSTMQVKDLVLEKGSCLDYRARVRSNSTTTIRTLFPEVQFHCDATGHYIAQHLTCDGVIDCPMGEDEGEHCANHKLDCSLGGISCSRRRFRYCLTDRTLFCNGIKDCDDGADESPSFCLRKEFCKNRCLNDGQCWTNDDQAFECDCKELFSGSRCQIDNSSLAD